MKPPEKLEEFNIHNKGYNQAIDDMNKWINQAPIEEIIVKAIDIVTAENLTEPIGHSDRTFASKATYKIRTLLKRKKNE